MLGDFARHLEQHRQGLKGGGPMNNNVSIRRDPQSEYFYYFREEGQHSQSHALTSSTTTPTTPFEVIMAHTPSSPQESVDQPLSHSNHRSSPINGPSRSSPVRGVPNPHMMASPSSQTRTAKRWSQATASSSNRTEAIYHDVNARRGSTQTTLPVRTTSPNGVSASPQRPTVTTTSPSPAQRSSSTGRLSTTASTRGLGGTSPIAIQRTATPINGARKVAQPIASAAPSVRGTSPKASISPARSVPANINPPWRSSANPPSMPNSGDYYYHSSIPSLSMLNGGRANSPHVGPRSDKAVPPQRIVRPPATDTEEDTHVGSAANPVQDRHTTRVSEPQQRRSMTPPNRTPRSRSPQWARSSAPYQAASSKHGSALTPQTPAELLGPLLPAWLEGLKAACYTGTRTALDLAASSNVEGAEHSEALDKAHSAFTKALNAILSYPNDLRGREGSSEDQVEDVPTSPQMLLRSANYSFHQFLRACEDGVSEALRHQRDGSAERGGAAEGSGAVHRTISPALSSQSVGSGRRNMGILRARNVVLETELAEANDKVHRMERALKKFERADQQGGGAVGVSDEEHEGHLYTMLFPLTGTAVSGGGQRQGSANSDRRSATVEGKRSSANHHHGGRSARSGSEELHWDLPPSMTPILSAADHPQLYSSNNEGDLQQHGPSTSRSPTTTTVTGGKHEPRPRAPQPTHHTNSKGSSVGSDQVDDRLRAREEAVADKERALAKEIELVLEQRRLLRAAQQVHNEAFAAEGSTVTASLTDITKETRSGHPNPSDSPHVSAILSTTRIDEDNSAVEQDEPLRGPIIPDSVHEKRPSEPRKDNPAGLSRPNKGSHAGPSKDAFGEWVKEEAPSFASSGSFSMPPPFANVTVVGKAAVRSEQGVPRHGQLSPAVSPTKTRSPPTSRVTTSPLRRDSFVGPTGQHQHQQPITTPVSQRPKVPPSQRLFLESELGAPPLPQSLPPKPTAALPLMDLQPDLLEGSRKSSAAVAPPDAFLTEMIRVSASPPSSPHLRDMPYLARRTSVEFMPPLTQVSPIMGIAEPSPSSPISRPGPNQLRPVVGTPRQLAVLPPPPQVSSTPNAANGLGLNASAGGHTAASPPSVPKSRPTPTGSTPTKVAAQPPPFTSRGSTPHNSFHFAQSSTFAPPPRLPPMELPVTNDPPRPHSPLVVALPSKAPPTRPTSSPMRTALVRPSAPVPPPTTGRPATSGVLEARTSESPQPSRPASTQPANSPLRLQPPPTSRPQVQPHHDAESNTTTVRVVTPRRPPPTVPSHRAPPTAKVTTNSPSPAPTPPVYVSSAASPMPSQLPLPMLSDGSLLSPQPSRHAPPPPPPGTPRQVAGGSDANRKAPPVPPSRRPS